MKDKRLGYIVCLVAVFLLQRLLGVSWRSVYPDLQLVVLIFICVRMDSVFGILFGMLSGLLNYTASGTGFGALLVAGCAAGFLASNPARLLSRSSGITVLVSVIWITCVYNAILYLFAPRDITDLAVLTGMQVLANAAAALVIWGLMFLFGGRSAVYVKA
ncbi:MAG: hypothetical protein IK083_01030 [Abditibacteriota bacterium]|nr:hypothetical protein [Abditibacteriota bacterium]